MQDNCVHHLDKSCNTVANKLSQQKLKTRWIRIYTLCWAFQASDIPGYLVYQPSRIIHYPVKILLPELGSIGPGVDKPSLHVCCRILLEVEPEVSTHKIR